MNERGITLQTSIVTAVLALAAAATGIVIYNVVRDESKEIDENAASTANLLRFWDVAVDPPDDIDPDGGDDELFGSDPLLIYSGSNYNCAAFGEPGGSLQIVLASTDPPIKYSALQCWGGNEYGQLGVESRDTRTSTVNVNGGFKAVAMGSSNTCAILSIDILQCVGENTYGQLGDADLGAGSYQFQNIVLFDVHAVDVGHAGTICAIAGTDKKVYCWGRNKAGAIFGVNYDYAKSYFPLEIAGITGAEDIVVGETHACAVLSDVIKCWGGDLDFAYAGELGDGNSDADYVFQPQDLDRRVGLGATPRQSYSPRVVSNSQAEVVDKIVAGRQHTCVLTTLGEVLCWGSDNQGQLGRDVSANFGIPERIPNLGGVRDLDAYGDSTCVLTRRYEIQCWGALNFGPVADSPVSQPNSRFISLSVGESHVCAGTSEGNIKCLGAPNKDTRVAIGLSPTAIYNTNIFIPTGIEKDGGIPYQDRTAMLRPNQNDSIPKPKIHLFAGAYHNCVAVEDLDLSNGIKSIKRSGSEAGRTSGEYSAIQCWGSNENQQIQAWKNPSTDTDYGSSHIPILRTMETSFKSIQGGPYNTCIISTIETLFCSGKSSFGELSIFAPLSPGASAPAVAYDAFKNPHGMYPILDEAVFSGVKKVEGADGTLCALVDSLGDGNNKVYCWGENDTAATDGTNRYMFGQDADGNNYPQANSLPKEIRLDYSAETIAAEEKNKGDVGGGYELSEIHIKPTDKIMDIAVGEEFICVLLEQEGPTPTTTNVPPGGRTLCQGNGIYGQLGYVIDGSRNPRSGDYFRVVISSQSFGLLRTTPGFTDIDAGSSHICVEDNSRTGTYNYPRLVCFGRNHMGQAGVNRAVTEDPNPGSEVRVLSDRIWNDYTAIDIAGDTTCYLYDYTSFNLSARVGPVGPVDANGRTDLRCQGALVLDVESAAGTKFVALSTGYEHVCVVVEDSRDGRQEVQCAGDNSKLQLGQPASVSSSTTLQTVQGIQGLG